jgi:PAS domain S-box-containing protein
MNRGMASKLFVAYFSIIITIVISGLFCLYVLRMNQVTNEEITTVTRPSLDKIKELKSLMLDAKKLTNSWAFAKNKRDQEKLKSILTVDFPALINELKAHSAEWKNKDEVGVLGRIMANNDSVIRNITTITAILNGDEAYVNDAIMEQAENLNSRVDKKILANDKLFARLIAIKNENLATQQLHIASLLNMLYITIFSTIVLAVVISFISLRLSQSQIITPLLALNKIILSMATGEVTAVPGSARRDEIGQMQNAISKMVNGVIQKINFAEQIGKGNYNQDFSLLSESDKLGGALVSMRDDLVKANKILMEQDQGLKDAQRIAKIGNYFYNTIEKKFQSSTTFDEIMGIYNDEDKTLDNWMALILPEYKEQVYNSAIRSITENTPFSEQYVITQYGTGKKIWVAVKGENIIDESGKTISVFGTVQDITESKTLEIDLNQSYQIATEQNKRLSNFSYIVSHNLRMYAVNINGLLKLYTVSKKENEREEIFEMLLKAGERLDETLFHLNEVTAMQGTLKVEIEPLRLSTYIGNALDALNTQIVAKNAIIHNNVNPEDTVNYNPAYLDSIILNLVSNAIKYCHPDRQPVVTIDFFKEHQHLNNYSGILQVTDNGIGINMALNEHKLFGMYKTFHNNKDAKGLGLFMTKYQVDAMAGQIIVTSEVNKGTTFKVFIK